MSQETINIGTVAGDGTGDQLRVAFGKTNSNFTELYAAIAAIGTPSFTFAQPTPSTVWTITHNLGRYPQVTVVDTTGRQLEADVAFISTNQLVVSGTVAFAGTAYLS